MSALDDRPFPRGAIIGAGLMIAATIAIVGVYQLDKRNGPPPPSAFDSAKPIEQRMIRFVEDPPGVVARATDAETGEVIDELIETDGFIRTVLLSMAFDRRRLGIEDEPVFKLVLWDDTRLSIEDLTTGVRVNLGAFGGPNKAVFARFLEHGPTNQ